MARKKYAAEQMVTILRQIEVETSKGRALQEVCRQLEITEQTYYRWRKEYNTVRPHSALEYKPPAPETKELVSISTFDLKPCLILT